MQFRALSGSWKPGLGRGREVDLATRKCLAIALRRVLHSSHIVYGYDFRPNDRRTGRIRDQTVYVPVGGLREQGKGVQYYANKNRNKTGEANVGSPASNGFSTHSFR